MFVSNRRIFSALPRGAASSDAAPASVLASVKAWEPFEKPQDRFEK